MTTDPRFDGPGPEAEWRARLAAGTFAIQHCAACGGHQFPPQTLCTRCGAPAPALVAASGAGTVYSTTTVRRRDGAHNVALVDLAEGPRMMSRVEGDPQDVVIGMAVRARIRGEGEEAMVVFDPAEAGR